MRKMTTLKTALRVFMASVLFTAFSSTVSAQYVVDFEGAGEESSSYPAEVVNLSGLDWNVGPEVQIAGETNDFKNGLRSARIRGRNGSVLEMIEDKINGMGTVSFVYRIYGSDSNQQPWAVEYSDDQGVTWTQIGADFTATGTVQTFQETVNVEGDVRLRIRLTTTPGTSGDRRINVDDITITDYVAGAPVITPSVTSLSGITYEEGNGPSVEETVLLTGNNLIGAGNLTVTASVNYEVSTDGITYASTALIPYDAEVITGSGELYVRLAGGLTSGIYTGTITVDGGSASAVTINVSGLVTASLYPPLHDLSSGAYSFTEWDDASAAYAYPSNIRFWAAASDQVTLNEQPIGNYTGAYNLSSASRINGLNANGVSFVATGSVGAGYPLGAVLGINTLGKEDIEVSWTGGLITQGEGSPTPRFYGLRLQYQIGQSAVWTDVPGPIEFLSENRTDGDFEDFGPTVLPATCNNQAEVYLRWVYYFIAANDGGSRPNLRLDEILVDGSDIVDPSVQVSVTSLSGFNQVLGAPSSEQSFTVSGENLEDDITLTVSGEYEISLTSGSGFTSSVIIPHTGGTVTATTVYVRLNAAALGIHTETITVTSQNVTDVVVDLDGETTEPVSEDLLYYWHFNDMLSGSDVTEIIADYSYLPAIDGKFTYTDPITGERDIDRYDSGSSFNLHQGESEGYSARVRNPSTTRSLVFDVPTIGAEGIGLRYAVQRSGQGMLYNIVQYSVDGINFISTDLINDTLEVVGSEQWQLFTFDFSSITAVNNNPNFKIKITWNGNTVASNGNNRYDNITLTALSTVPVALPTILTSVTSLSGFSQALGTPSSEQSFTVSGENLEDDIELTASAGYEVSLTSGSGFASSVTLPHTGGTVASTTVYVRLDALTSGTHTGTITASSQNVTDVVVNLNGQTTGPGEDALLYYWHFNNMPSGPDVTEIIADYSYLPSIDGKFTYTDPITGERDIDRYDTGSSFNLHQGELAGYAARVRNPSTTRSLVFDVPTTGAEGIGLDYAVQRSGQGMLYNIVQYSVDGINFISTDLVNDTLEVVGSEEWQLFTFDFSSITAVNDNPDFKIKITWHENTVASNGNNRYDNITLKASSVIPVVLPTILTSVTSLSGFSQALGTPSSEQSFTVSGENLEDDIELTASAGYEVSLTSGSGFASSVTLPHTGGTVASTTVYVRLDALTSGTHTGTITASSQNAADVVVNLNGQTTGPGEDALLYYWHFNNMASGPDVTEIIADYSYLPSIDGKFTYTDPITGERDIDRYDTGSSFNLHQGELAGYAARVRNPSTTRSLVFDVPTTGAEGIGLDYAVQRSGQGMLYNIVQYSVDGINFISTDLVNDTLEVVGSEQWQLFTFDFSSITAVNDNPDFKIKITWHENTVASNGNNRYDNITLKAASVDPNVSLSKVAGEPGLTLYPVPFEEMINISSPKNIKEIQIIDLLGKVVKTLTGNNTKFQQISTDDLNSGSYIFMIETTEGTHQIKSVKK